MQRIKVNHFQQRELQNAFGVKTLSTTFNLTHEGHIPNIGCLLVSGYATVVGLDPDTGEKKILEKINSGTLLGYSNLILDIPSDSTIEIAAGSSICIMDRTSIRDSFVLESHSKETA